MGEQIKYYSLVGDRAIPVVMPIFYLLKKHQDKQAEITLIYYNERSQPIADISRQFLESQFPERVRINTMLYSKFKDSLKQRKFEEQAYINLTPGMNWQVAETVLNLPRNAKCLYMDYTYLYTFTTITTPIEKANVRKIGADLTIENYQVLNPDIQIIQHTKPHRFLKECDFIEHVGYRINLKFTPFKKYSHWVNYSLIYLQEKRGFLYLLFDLTEDGIHQDIKSMEDNKISRALLRLYRLILGSLNPLNYGITIITDSKWMRSRAERDGIAVIMKHRNVDIRNKIEEWIKSPPEPKKSRIDINAGGFIKSPQISKFRSALFLCSGDNVVSTLKAIKSHKNVHNIDRVFLFYDNQSKRIKSIADRLANSLNCIGMGLPSIELLETDHVGSGMVAKIGEIVESNKKANYYFNITPGTKAQTISLTQAAIIHNLNDSLFSIDEAGYCLRKISDSSNAGSIDDILPHEIIKFYCPTYKAQTDTTALESTKDKWDYILNGLAKGWLVYHGLGLGGIINKKTGKPAFDKSEAREIYRKILEKWPDLLKKNENRSHGLWWELATYYALVKHRISDNIMFSAHCKTEHGLYISELDIVFSYGKKVVVISCKTEKKHISLDALEVVSEAKSRFGRMAVCMISVPSYKDEPWIDVREDAIVRVITAKDLNDGRKLSKAIQHHIDKLSKTTSNRHKKRSD